MNLLVIIGLGYGADYFQADLHSLSRDQSNPESFNFPEDNTLRFIGIMAQFPDEVPDNPKTSGNGQFLSDTSGSYIEFFESEIHRCEDFLVDKPPHNASYFQAQLHAVGNYYEHVSNNNLFYTAEIISNSSEHGYYTVSREMEHYAKGDALLAEFFSEALDSAKSDIDVYFTTTTFTPDDVIFVVFHAGLSQDFSYPSLDPTIYDLKSAYIDTIMMEDIVPTIILHDGNSYDINTGILLPETQNIIYYDVVEDIFGNPDNGTEDLCDIQVGITGIFAFLLGYELGLPPMFDTETGHPGVGNFGLMDYGSNNGRGVIPASPTPWTRIQADWSTEINIDSLENLNSIFIEAHDTTVYRFDIAKDEYFLIENRNNWVLAEADIDSLRKEHKIDDDQLGHWFDVVTASTGEFVQNNLIEIDGDTDVITRFNHYDYGLPGSGILIWHIKEPDENLYSVGVNNNKYNRHVQIEEADGSLDIGFESYAFFSSDDPTTGTPWDMWYDGNEAYEFANPERYTVTFNNWSNPNSRTTDGAESFLSIRILTDIADSMYIRVITDNGIEIVNLSDEPVEYLGNAVKDDTAYVFYGKGGNIYRHSQEYGADSILAFDPDVDKFIFTYNNSVNDSVYVTDNQYSYFDTFGIIHDDHIAPRGYIIEYDSPDTAHISLSPSPFLSFGDIDFDGLDEIVTTDNGTISVINSNGTMVNGFPVNGDFKGVPLIANILEDSNPEIICREGDDIVIISNRGERLRQLSSLDADQPLSMVPFWTADTIALIDGSRLFLFQMDLEHSYWLNARSLPSGFPISSGTHVPPNNPNMDRQPAYNYPNPITEGYTTFRFFVETSTLEVQVRIYDAAGFLVKDDLELTNPTEKEYNEIKWDNIQIDSGLYLAEIKRDTGGSELVRLVVIK